MKLNQKQRKTLDDIYSDPVKKNINWKDIQSLVNALGGVLDQGNGSRVRFFLNNVVAVFHCPHPQKETPAYVVKNVREFLAKAGITN